MTSTAAIAVQKEHVEPVLWTIDDVAEATRLSRRHVYRLLDRGDFPAPRKVGRRNMWLPDEVKAWTRKLPRAS